MILLNEVFDDGRSAQKIEWRRKDNNLWYGTFKSKGFGYILEIKKYNDKNKEEFWNVIFKISPALTDKIDKIGADFMDMMKTIGSRNSIEVFSIVVNGVKEFIKQVHPNIIVFEDVESNRTKLYQKLIDKFAPQLGYISNHSDKMFRLIKK